MFSERASLTTLMIELLLTLSCNYRFCSSRLDEERTMMMMMAILVCFERFFEERRWKKLTNKIMQNYCKVFCQFRTFHSALFCVCVNKAMEMNRIKYWKFHFMHNWIRSRSSSSAGKISAFNFSYLIFPFSHPPIDRLSATLSRTHKQ